MAINLTLSHYDDDERDDGTGTQETLALFKGGNPAEFFEAKERFDARNNPREVRENLIFKAEKFIDWIKKLKMAIEYAEQMNAELPNDPELQNQTQPITDTQLTIVEGYFSLIGGGSLRGFDFDTLLLSNFQNCLILVSGRYYDLSTLFEEGEEAGYIAKRDELLQLKPQDALDSLVSLRDSLIEIEKASKGPFNVVASTQKQVAQVK